MYISLDRNVNTMGTFGPGTLENHIVEPLFLGKIVTSEMYRDLLETYIRSLITGILKNVENFNENISTFQ